METSCANAGVHASATKTMQPRTAPSRAEATAMRAKAVRRSEQLLFPRPWTRAERRVVWHGLFGRSLIAVEPLICFLVFAALTSGLIFFPLPATSKMTRWESAIVLAPIFGLAASAFFVYFVGVMLAPVRALLDTFRPLYKVDGYVRYRSLPADGEAGNSGYVAVLDHRGRTVAEWPVTSEAPFVDDVRPALVEFSFYGGIHRIDGRSTGVLPEKLATFGVGIASRR